jgi:hypothetical protein
MIRARGKREEREYNPILQMTAYFKSVNLVPFTTVTASCCVLTSTVLRRCRVRCPASVPPISVERIGRVNLQHEHPYM